MILYCDTSALLKLFVDEEGSDSMVKARDVSEAIAVCRITWAESMAAFAQRSRSKGANQPMLAKARVALEQAWATFLYLFNRAHLQEFGQVLQAWMISQIPGGAEGLDQLVCDGKTLRGSAVEAEDGSHRFVAQVTVYARALGVALAQKSYDTGESSERCALQELLSNLVLGEPWMSSLCPGPSKAAKLSPLVTEFPGTPGSGMNGTWPCEICQA